MASLTKIWISHLSVDGQAKHHASTWSTNPLGRKLDRNIAFGFSPVDQANSDSVFPIGQFDDLSVCGLGLSILDIGHRNGITNFLRPNIVNQFFGALKGLAIHTGDGIRNVQDSLKSRVICYLHNINTKKVHLGFFSSCL